MHAGTLGRCHHGLMATSQPAPRTHLVCTPALAEPRLSRAQAEEQARRLKAVADPVRLQLLSMIRATPNGEACVCDLTPSTGLSQPTVSHHLKILTDAGILTRERRGPWAWFTLVPDQLVRIAASIVANGPGVDPTT